MIDESLEIRRYGAAADAWETLASLHDQVHDVYPAQQARLEAARLYASMGQMTHVYRLLDGVDQSQISTTDLADIKSELGDLFEQHEQNVLHTSQARDYQMLYHHYLRNGELEQAWNFRIKSSQILADSSERVMYQRQADVIAVLYNSNFAIDRAKEYLQQAEGIYQDKGARELLEETRDMESLIY